MLCFAWLRVERQVQARWSCRKWFIGTEPWPAATAPWAAILSDLLNRAGLGLFVPSVEDLRGEPGCCKTLLSIVPWAMLFPPREERAGSAGRCCGMAPLQGGAALGMESRGNKQTQLCALSEFRARQELALDFQGDLGS